MARSMCSRLISGIFCSCDDDLWDSIRAGTRMPLHVAVSTPEPHDIGAVVIRP